MSAQDFLLKGDILLLLLLESAQVIEVFSFIIFYLLDLSLYNWRLVLISSPGSFEMHSVPLWIQMDGELFYFFCF